MSAKPDKLARMGIVHAAPTGGNDEVAEMMRLVDRLMTALLLSRREGNKFGDEDAAVQTRAALEAHLTQLLTDEYWRGVRREGPPAQPTELPKVYAPCVCSSPESIKLRNDKDGRWSCPRHGHMPKYPPVQSTECVERALQAITDFDQERERHELPDQVQAAVDEHAVQPTEPWIQEAMRLANEMAVSYQDRYDGPLVEGQGAAALEAHLRGGKTVQPTELPKPELSDALNADTVEAFAKRYAAAVATQSATPVQPTEPVDVQAISDALDYAHDCASHELSEAQSMYGQYPRDGLGRKITYAEDQLAEIKKAKAALAAPVQPTEPTK